MLLNEEMKIEDMLKNQIFDGFIHINGQLPYLIDIMTDLYIFELPVNINGEYNINNRKRKILFTTCQKWIENQKVPSIKSVLAYNPMNQSYTNRISKYKICIQLFNDEFEELINDKIFDDKIKMLYQTILSYISIKYNQCKLGSDCINICIEDSGAPQIMLYQKQNSGYKLINCNIIPSFTVSKSIIHKEIEFNKLLEVKDIIWLYYFNQAIYSFDRQDYLNTVIYCAISLESYLNYLIENNGLHDEFEEYNKNLKLEGKVPGFFTTCKFLKKENIISNSLDKKIKECYGGLSTQRNDIVHGNITNILLDSSISKIGINKLNEIYSINERGIIK